MSKNFNSKSASPLPLYLIMRCWWYMLQVIPPNDPNFHLIFFKYVIFVGKRSVKEASDICNFNTSSCNIRNSALFQKTLVMFFLHDVKNRNQLFSWTHLLYNGRRKCSLWGWNLVLMQFRLTSDCSVLTSANHETELESLWSLSLPHVFKSVALNINIPNLFYVTWWVRGVLMMSV
jgi:hypothetical protein